jgi:NAD(P)H-flavin reductase
MSDPLIPKRCRIRSWHRDSADVFTLELEPPADYGGFAAGQFNMLYVPGAGESAISISGDPDLPGNLVHTIRAVGNVTRQLQQRQAGDEIGLRGPFGRGWPVREAEGKDLLILAGGIGLAPLRPVLYSVMARPQRFRSVSLVVGARSPADLLYTEQLLRWKAEGKLRLLVTVDTADAEWRGDVGVITNLMPRLEFDPERALAMICGPEIMIRFCVSKLRERGLPASDIHVSLERNMKCAVGFCGHCQLGPKFVCRNGPVFAYEEVEKYLMTEGF